MDVYGLKLAARFMGVVCLSQIVDLMAVIPRNNVHSISIQVYTLNLWPMTMLLHSVRFIGNNHVKYTYCSRCWSIHLAVSLQHKHRMHIRFHNKYTPSIVVYTYSFRSDFSFMLLFFAVKSMMIDTQLVKCAV